MAYPIISGLKFTNSETSAFSSMLESSSFPSEKSSDFITKPSGLLNDFQRNESLIPATPVQKWTTVIVNPQIVNLTASDSFVINVSVINVTNLSGYDLRLGYNDTIITAIDVSVGEFFPKNCYVVRQEITKNVPNAENIPTVWVAVGAPLGSEFKASGNGNLATVRFKAISTGNCSLKLYFTQLVADYASGFADIPHNVVDGYVQCKIYEHETAAYLTVPAHLQPGASFIVNGSAINKGLCNETNVSFDLLIDGEVVNSTVADLLTAGSAISLTYVFTPYEEKTYNATAYVRPVSNEEYVQNNEASTNVVVRTEIRVPQDYATIQEAIDAAVSGETIIVSSGTYSEHIGIGKPLTLVGENWKTTFIDGDGENEVIVIIKASDVTLSKFTIRNGAGGILLEYSSNSVIADNIITNTMDALSLQFSNNNTIISNTIKDNEMGLFLGNSNNNIVYWNNFINNTEQVVTIGSYSTWDNGIAGNYWSDYKSEDTNGDGVGDAIYVIDSENSDNYPLIKPIFE